MTDTDILLESGTNEVEILEFLLGNQSFGLNVSKVTSIEIFEESRRNTLPQTVPEIMGTFLFRGDTIPLINAAEVLGKHASADNERPLVVTVEFNNFVCGLYVDGVNRIHRVAWDQFEPLDRMFSQANSSILGSVHVQDRDVLILDIESIGSRYFEGVAMCGDITISEEGMEGEEIESLHQRRTHAPIMLAEDSPMIRGQITNLLHRAGYVNLEAFENGRKALEAIQAKADADPQWPQTSVRLLISDIEMPVMDGLTLCRRVKEIPGGQQFPVVMFSSLINAQMAAKCESVGANGWITKPEIDQLVALVDKFALTTEPTGQLV